MKVCTRWHLVVKINFCLLLVACFLSSPSWSIAQEKKDDNDINNILDGADKQDEKDKNDLDLNKILEGNDKKDDKKIEDNDINNILNDGDKKGGNDTIDDPEKVVRDPEALKAMTKGDEAMAAEKFEDAVKAYGEAFNIERKNPKAPAYVEAYFKIGLANLAMENVKSATSIFEQIIGLDPNNIQKQTAKANYQLGLIFNENNEFDQAVGYFQSAIELDRKEKEYFGSKGYTLVQLGSYEEALEDLDKAIELDTDKDYAEAYYNRGVAHSFLQDPKKALEDYLMATKIEKEDPLYFLDLGMTYQTLEKPAEAVDAISKAIDIKKKLEEEDVIPYNLRAVALMVQSREEADSTKQKSLIEKALADCSSALEIDDKNLDALYNRGQAFSIIKNYPKAIAAFTESLKIDKQYTEAIFQRGIAFFESQELDIAAIDFDEVARIQGDDARPYLWLGVIRSQQGKDNQAVVALSSAIRLDPNNAEAYHNRALVYMRLKEYEKAISDLNEAIRQNSEDSSAFYRRGLAYAHLGKNKQALISLNSALRLSPQHVNALKTRSIVYSRLGNEEKSQADKAAYEKINSKK